MSVVSLGVLHKVVSVETDVILHELRHSRIVGILLGGLFLIEALNPLVSLLGRHVHRSKHCVQSRSGQTLVIACGFKHTDKLGETPLLHIRIVGVFQTCQKRGVRREVTGLRVVMFIPIVRAGSPQRHPGAEEQTAQKKEIFILFHIFDEVLFFNRLRLEIVLTAFSVFDTPYGLRYEFQIIEHDHGAGGSEHTLDSDGVRLAVILNIDRLATKDITHRACIP